MLILVAYHWMFVYILSKEELQSSTYDYSSNYTDSLVHKMRMLLSTLQQFEHGDKHPMLPTWTF